MIADVWCPWCRDHQRAELTADRDALRRELDALRQTHTGDLARERERDEAREVAVRLGEVCEQQARMLARAPSFEDAMALCIHAIVEPATDAPNCAEWRGTMRGRGFVLSLQWADGKSPQTLLSEAMAERDTARSAHAELAAAVREYLDAEDGYDPGCPGGCGVVECCTREAVDAARTVLDAALAGCV